MERQFKIGDMVTVNNNAGNLKYVGFVTKTYEGGALEARAPMVPIGMPRTSISHTTVSTL